MCTSPSSYIQTPPNTAKLHVIRKLDWCSLRFGMMWSVKIVPFPRNKLFYNHVEQSARVGRRIQCRFLAVRFSHLYFQETKQLIKIKLDNSKNTNI